jgi:hypothetical protein
MAIHHFLIVFNRKTDDLLKFVPFGRDVHRATAEYTAVEREYRDRPDHEDFEIVLVGADSRETLEVTHSRYFKKREAVPF